jgi:hypothetical protein
LHMNCHRDTADTEKVKRKRAPLLIYIISLCGSVALWLCGKALIPKFCDLI